MDLVIIRYGRNFSGTGQNLGQGFIALKHWDARAGQANTAQAIRERAIKYFKQYPNAQVNVNMPSSVSGLGQTDGLEFWIRDMDGKGLSYLEDKLKVIDIIANKCKVNNRNDFEFYQAYYYHENKNIQHKKLSLIKFEN